MARTSFSDIFYASAPGAKARDEADALLNTELESSLIPKSQPAPRPGSWRTTAPGTFVRDDPSTGTVTTIENSGGTVYSKIDRYTPPPVDERKSYAEILLDDIPKRIEMVEYAETPEAFLTNIFKPAEVTGIERLTEGGPVNVYVRQRSDLGIAIGKAGCNIEKARMLCKRFFDMDVGEVLLAAENPL